MYAVDTFTAINLLVFDKWSGQVKPAIPLEISRWIFAGCIILSFVLLFYRWLRAIRVIRSGGIAQSYLDPLAVRIQSARVGKNGRGWKRFLLFADLTKSRKGADYVALFSYFSFEGIVFSSYGCIGTDLSLAWLRICFAEGPRQVINAITLYSVLKLNLVPEGEHAAKDGHTPIVQFFVNIQALADKNKEQAVILFGMLFTLIVWVITAINLVVACLLYVLFLWHHVPSRDNGLSGYCRRKINERLEKIIKIRINKAMKKEDELRAKQERKDLKKQPTLPTLPHLNTSSTDKLPLISRTTTQSSLPAYASRPDTPGSLSSSPPDARRQPTLPDLDFGPRRPGLQGRNLTQASAMSTDSYGSNAPLMSAAGEMGYGPPGRAQTPMESRPDSPYGGGRPPPSRSATGFSQSTQRSYTPGFRPPTAQSRETPNSYAMGPIPRPGTAMSGPPGSLGRQTPGPPPGRGTPGPMSNPYGHPPPNGGRSTPMAMGGPPPRSGTPAGGGYTPFNPAAGRGTSGPGQSADYFTSRPAYPPRAGTAPPNANMGDGYDDIYDSYSSEPPQAQRQMPPRAQTTTPSGGGGGGGYGGYGGRY